MAQDHDPSGERHFEGSYSLSAPNLFFRSPPQTLDFTLDPAGVLTFAPESAKAIEEHGIASRVEFERLHTNDPRGELGPVCKVSLCWTNDASPELYAFGLFRQGGRYREVVKGIALAWAYSISNDGEAGLHPDREAKIDFTPGKTG